MEANDFGDEVARVCESDGLQVRAVMTSTCSIGGIRALVIGIRHYVTDQDGCREPKDAR